jgi:cytochrome b561
MTTVQAPLAQGRAAPRAPGHVPRSRRLHGPTLYLLVLIRIAARAASHVLPLPPMRPWQRAAARTSQVLLFAVAASTSCARQANRAYGT